MDARLHFLEFWGYGVNNNWFIEMLHIFLAGFWYPYKNIFALVDELGLKPFTQWTKSAQFSPAGLEVKVYTSCRS